jgi:hypothetical protein
VDPDSPQEPLERAAGGDAASAVERLASGDDRPYPPFAARAQAGPMEATLAYVAAAVIWLWGVAHAVPTTDAVAGVEPITPEEADAHLDVVAPDHAPIAPTFSDVAWPVHTQLAARSSAATR